MIVGIDIGGTFIKLGLISESGEILKSDKYPTEGDKLDFDAFLEKLCVKINSLTEGQEFSGIGIGIPGHLGADRRKIIDCPNVPVLKRAALIDELQDLFPDKLIRMENDSNCATLGELHFGRHKKIDNFMLITLGTGVGSGLVIDGQLFTGPGGNACEVGMIPVKDGVFLEDLIGQQHIATYAERQLEKGLYVSSKLRNLNKFTPRDISEAAEMGDQLALDTFAYVGQRLGEALVSIIHMFDVNTIIFGGGISGALDYFYPAMKAELRRRCIDYYTDDLVVLKATLNSESGIVGAASLVVELPVEV